LHPLRTCVRQIIHKVKDGPMDFLKRMQPKDWMIAAVAFIAGAIVF
jgi:hypothetical protein